MPASGTVEAVIEVVVGLDGDVVALVGAVVPCVVDEPDEPVGGLALSPLPKARPMTTPTTVMTKTPPTTSQRRIEPALEHGIRFHSSGPTLAPEGIPPFRR